MARDFNGGGQGTGQGSENGHKPEQNGGLGSGLFAQSSSVPGQVIQGDGGANTLVGGEGPDTINGGNGNDTITGAGGDDNIQGGRDDDVIDAGAGNDDVQGGRGNDAIVAGDGNDSVKGGDGNDTVKGGEGDDDLEGGKDFDTAQWDGELGDFTFTAAQGNRILVTDQNPADGNEGADTIKEFELLSFGDFDLYLDGTNNLPYLQVADQTTNEDTGPTSFTFDAVEFEGEAITLDAVSTSVTHTLDGVVATPPQTGWTLSPLSGALTPTVAAPLGSAFPDAEGYSLTFTFDPDPGDPDDTAGPFDYLGAGDTAVVSVSVDLSDDSANTATYDFEIEVTGVNDAIAITSEDLAGAVTEDDDTPDLTDSGTIGFTDVDLSDVHSVSVTTSSSTHTSVLGSLTPVISDAATGDGVGEVTWTYSVPNAAVQFLGLGDTITETFTVELKDNEGSIVTRDVAVTVTGINDEIAITSEDLAGAVTEDAANPDLTDSGTIGFTDVDLSDVHSVQVTGSSSTHTSVLGSLTPQITDPATGDGAGEVTWTYTVPNAAVQFLGAGDTVTETFTVALTDNEGSTVTRDVAVTVTGVNDTPTANSDTATTDAGVAVNIDVLGNDTDPDAGDILTVFSVADPENGSAVVLGTGEVQYTPDPGFVGTDSFEYTLSDGEGGFDTATITVGVGGAVANTPPIVQSGVLNFDNDGLITLDFNTQMLNGRRIMRDAEQTIAELEVISIEVETNGRVTAEFTETGPDTDIFTLDPADLPVPEGGFLKFSVFYQVSDGLAVSDGTLQLVVNDVLPPENQAPVAGDFAITQDEDDGNITVDLLGAPTSDPDGDALSLTSLLFTDASGERLSFNPLELGGTSVTNGVLEVDPIVFGVADGETQTFQAVYTITDEEFSDEGVVTFNITGTEINSDPVASDASGERGQGDTTTVVIPTGNPSPPFFTSVQVISVDLTPFGFDYDRDPLTFSLDSVTDSLGDPIVNDDKGTPETGDDTFSFDGGVVTINYDELGLGADESVLLNLNFSVDDARGTPDSGVFALTVNGSSSGPSGQLVVDFEEFASSTGFEIALSDIGGLGFEGTARAYEVDEMIEAAGPRGGGVAPGFLNGTNGDNSARLEGTDETFDGTNPPTYAFNLYAPGAERNLDSGPLLTGGTPAQVAEQLENAFGPAFDFESMVLTLLAGADETVTIVPYRVVDLGSGEYDYEAVGSFDVTASSASALALDFDTGAFFDAGGAFDDPLTTGVTETSAFENIVAVQFITTGETSESRDSGEILPFNDDALVVDDMVFNF